jgi:predicted MFS family arabinose efflux permease
LPSGVWLDRVRKLPVYIAGELCIAVVLASVPLAAWSGVLSMMWLYVCGFVMGSVATTAGSAAQIVLTQVVPRSRLVEAHAKNALASSGSEVAGPGLVGLLIKAVGAPVALLLDAILLMASAAILLGVRVNEQRVARADAHFWRDLKAGVRFVRSNALLVALACAVGVWQMSYHAAMVVQILFATRTLGMSEQAVGLSYVALGVGSVLASVLGHRVSRRLGPGPSLVIGFALCGVAWLLLAAAPAGEGTGAWGVAAFAVMLLLFSMGAVFIFINFLSMRQAVTPAHLLGRMTSTMRWLILLPAGPGALLGGWLGEHFGLRASLTFAGVTALMLALVAWRNPVIAAVKVLPQPQAAEEWVGAEADVRPAVL